MNGSDFDSKRPDHPDFMDANELKKLGFSGLRHNQLSNQMEIWVCGNIAKVIPQKLMDQAVDKNAVIAMALEEVFGIYDVAIEGMQPEREEQESRKSKNVIIGLDGKTFH